MSDEVEEELKAQRLADYSNAVKRGRPEASGDVDPLDAAIVRRLNALGNNARPSAEYLAQAQKIFDSPPKDQSQVNIEGALVVPISTPAIDPAKARGQDSVRAAASSPINDNNVMNIRPLSRFERAWRSKSAIAAGLALFIATAALIVLLAIYLDNGNQPSAAVSTSTAVPTSAPTPAAALTPTIALNVFSSPKAKTSESYLLYPKFTEPSLVGLLTPTMNSFRSVSLQVTWDGQGAVVLSGCPDRACNYVLDDQLQLAVTNPENTEAPVRVSDNGTENEESRGLPIVLTGLFRKGDNQVTAFLIDRRGNERGARTPIYIVILR
jgi:hypothetical protein